MIGQKGKNDSHDASEDVNRDGEELLFQGSQQKRLDWDPSGLVCTAFAAVYPSCVMTVGTVYVNLSLH